MGHWRHKVSGARVRVRDDKVMDSSWEPVGAADPAPKPRVQRPTKTK